MIKAGRILLILGAISIGIYALGFFVIEAVNPVMKAHFTGMTMGAMTHIIPGGVAIILGVAQFMPSLRDRSPRLHRRVGQIYLLCVVFSAISALGLSMKPFGGVVGGLGLGVLAALWIYTGGRAYLAARRGDYHHHQKWMIRNYALTLAALTIRVYLGVLPLLGMTFMEAYQVSTWLSWVANLIVVEWWLLKRAVHPARINNRPH